MTLDPTKAIRKRAVVLVGAGASIDFGIPSTPALTREIERAVLADGWMQHSGGDQAFTIIKDRLAQYLRNPADVNFEHIYHCAHELIFAHPHTPSAVNEHRPLMNAFLRNVSGISKDAARALAQKIVSEIFRIASTRSSESTHDKSTLSAFLETLRGEFVTRIFTTNYDDIIFQSASDLYVGYDRSRSSPIQFDLDSFWNKSELDSCFHLHGSIHMAFPRPAIGDIGELFWYEDRNDAQRHASFNGSDDSRMDGTSVLRSATVTGLDKLSRLQVRPLSHFYSMLAQDLMAADIIFVIGSGLGDLHLNTWIYEARRRNPQPPLIFVGYWDGGFQAHFYPDVGSHQEIEMLHKLRINITNGPMNYNHVAPNWFVTNDGKSAVWGTGFGSFLADPASLSRVMSMLSI